MEGSPPDAHSSDPVRVDVDRPQSRRGMVANLFMGAGLVAGYGAFAAIAGRYLYPARPAERRWMFVARAKDVPPGSAIQYRTPAGAEVNVARRGESEDIGEFIALSSTCPHLGCRVHWQGDKNRFFCPCHNGVFDRDGEATEGPPADGGQCLSSFPLKIVAGLLYIEVPIGTLAQVPAGDGHDDCLREHREA